MYYIRIFLFYCHLNELIRMNENTNNQLHPPTPTTTTPFHPSIPVKHHSNFHAKIPKDHGHTLFLRSHAPPFISLPLICPCEMKRYRENNQTENRPYMKTQTRDLAAVTPQTFMGALPLPQPIRSMGFPHGLHTPFIDGGVEPSREGLFAGTLCCKHRNHTHLRPV